MESSHPKMEKIIVRGCAESETSEEVRTKLEGIDITGGGRLKVRGVIPRGRGEVLVLLGDSETKKRILDSEALKNTGLEAKELRGRRPRMLLRGVPRSREPEAFTEDLRKTNFPEVENFAAKFKLVFKTGRRDGETTNWVAEVDPDLRRRLKQE